MNHDIFISYSSIDKAIADAVVAALEQQGFRCWYAPRDIKPSADWGDSITEAINGCRIVLLIFSGSANQSQRVRDEIYYAISEEKVILPFRIENLDPTGAMRLHLSSRHWLDAYHPSWQAHLERLVSSVADTLGRPLAQLVQKAEPSQKEESLAADVPLPTTGKKVPWLWIGLVVVVVAGLSAAGVWWLGGREGGEKKEPTEIASAATSTPEQIAKPTMQPTNAVPAQAVFYPRNGHAYLFVDKSMSWYEAEGYCHSWRGYLATVQDAAENTFIYSLTRGNGWLGATDEEEEGAWEWVSGEPWDFENWSVNNPDNSSGEHYLSYVTEYPFQWNDALDQTQPFVCEWEPSDPGMAGGNVIVVISTEDSGEGSLRQALLDAKPGDTITFDPLVFSPERVGTIMLESALPVIHRGFLTLDASDAGVVLEGMQVSGDWTPAFEIDSEYNIIQGFFVFRFSGPGVILTPNASFNIIGGDKARGVPPLGEGNLFGENSDGMMVLGSDNIIMGNLIGTDSTGTANLGNRASGIVMEQNPSGNIIGPDNLIAHNGTEGGGGIEYRSLRGSNIITANAIYENQSQGIQYNFNEMPPFTYSTPPLILYADLETGSVSGQSCIGCIVEVYSTDTEDGKVYEGRAYTDDYGYFYFVTDKPLAGPYLTATSRLPGENTSEFSLAASARTGIQQAFTAIQDEAPVYQTSFDAWDFDEPQEDGREIADGKLALNSENGDRASLFLSSLRSDSFAVEFEFRFLNAEEEGAHCAIEAYYEEGGRAINASFSAEGQAKLYSYVHPDQSLFLTASNFDEIFTNNFMLIFLGDQIATFMNGQFTYTALNPDGSVVYTDRALSANGNIVCEFDNYRLWDLSGLDLGQ